LSIDATILSGEEGIAKAVELLRQGDVVGLPTETVYGLAGDAFQPMAAARIFEAKRRPLTDPLIVHLPEAGWLERVAVFDSTEQQQRVEQLGAAFWPGPLTLILNKHPELPDLVTAGMESVAVRVTAHPIFQEVLIRIDSPLAAPSANRFGRISPTTAEDVRLELGDMISLILDGGSCQHGMESTIVAVNGDSLEILRPGPITREQLSEYGHVSIPSRIVNTPGSLPGHYAPKKEFQIIKSDINSLVNTPDLAQAGILAFKTPPEEIAAGCAALEVLSACGDLWEAAANFYGALRRLDQSKADMIFAEYLPEAGIGVAIMDRMRRAAHGSIAANKT
jgi:L-threonylcarbamoyladenylate synthase